MYTLRIIHENGYVQNISLGDQYAVVRKASCEKEWDAHGKEIYSKDWSHASKNIYGFLLYGFNQTLTFDLMLGCSYYVMTESGQTFEKL